MLESAGRDRSDAHTYINMEVGGGETLLGTTSLAKPGKRVFLSLVPC